MLSDGVEPDGEPFIFSMSLLWSMTYERCRVLRPSISGRSTSVMLAAAVRSACPSGSRTAPSGSLAADSVQSAPIRPLLNVRPPIVIVSTESDCPRSDICVVSRDLSGISASPLSLKSKEMLRPLLIAKLPVPSMWAVFASLRLLLAFCSSSVGDGSASVAAEPHAIARAATELRSRRSTTRRYPRHSVAGPSKCSQRVSARWRRGLVLCVGSCPGVEPRENKGPAFTAGPFHQRRLCLRGILLVQRLVVG